MKKRTRNLFVTLNAGEKKKAIQLIFLDIVISLLNIAFLALLLYVIQFYTRGSSLVPSNYFPLKTFDQYPLLLIFIFFIAFSLKNFFGFRVLQKQLKFVYNVASRPARIPVSSSSIRNRSGKSRRSCKYSNAILFGY